MFNVFQILEVCHVKLQRSNYVDFGETERCYSLLKKVATHEGKELVSLQTLENPHHDRYQVFAHNAFGIYHDAGFPAFAN